VAADEASAALRSALSQAASLRLQYCELELRANRYLDRIRELEASLGAGLRLGQPVGTAVAGPGAARAVIRGFTRQLEQCQLELAQKESVIILLTNVADERLRLVESLHAEGERRLQLIDELSAAVDERQHRIEELSRKLEAGD
jgi:hypothetical protein